MLFVKVNEAKAAFEYGIEERPSLVVFDKGIPSLYENDNFKDADEILNWITGEVSGVDTVEAVTDSMLDMMIAKQRHVAAFFYNKECQNSLKTLGNVTFTLISISHFFNRYNYLYFKFDLPKVSLLDIQVRCFYRNVRNNR